MSKLEIGYITSIFSFKKLQIFGVEVEILEFELKIVDIVIFVEIRSDYLRVDPLFLDLIIASNCFTMYVGKTLECFTRASPPRITLTKSKIVSLSIEKSLTKYMGYRFH